MFRNMFRGWNITLTVFFVFILFGMVLFVPASKGVPPVRAQQTTDVLQRAFEKYAQERFDEVIALLEPERARPHVPEAVYRLLGSAYLLSGQYQMVLEVAAEGVVHYPRSAELQILQVDALVKIEPRKALEKLDRIVDDVEQGRLHSDPFRGPEWEQYQAGIYTLAGRSALELPDYAAAIRHFETAAELQPSEPAVYHQLLYAYLKAERYQDLLNACHQVPSWLQNDRTMVTLRSQALLELQEVGELLDIYRRRYDEDPDDLESAVIYGQLLMADNKLLKANELFNDLLERHPRDRRIYNLLMDLNRRQMNYHGMGVLLERMVHFFPDDEDLPLELAHVRELRGDDDGAVAIYDSLLLHRGQEYRFIRKKAALLYRTGDAGEAFKIIRGAEGPIKSHPEDRADPAEPVIRRFDKAVLAFQTGESQAAEPLLRSYLHDEPGDSLAWMMFGRVLEKMGMNDDALGAYRRAEAMGLLWPEMYVLQIRKSMEDDPMEVLLNGLDHVIRDIDQRTERLRLKAQLMMYGQVPEEVQPFYPLENQLREMMVSLDRLLDFAVDILPGQGIRLLLDQLMEMHEDNTRVLDMAARYYEKSGNPVQALHFYKTAVEINPNDSKRHLSIGEIMEERGEWADAVLWYERALGAGASSEVYGSLIRAHRENGTLDQLIDRWLVRYQAVRSDPELREYLIDALHRAGRREEAREIARQR